MEAFRINYSGFRSDAGQLDLIEAGESLVGLGTGLNRIAYFLEHNKVRYKGPYSEKNKIFVRPPEFGSFEYELAILLSSPVAAIGVNLTSSLFYDFTKAIFKRATGQDEPGDLAPWEKIAPPGTFDAVADSVSNPLKRFHAPVGETAKQIVIINGDGNTVHFNSDTKEYLSHDVYDPKIRTELAHVTLINGYDKSGRTFLDAEKRGVGFKIDKDIKSEDLEVLLWSHGQFVRGKDADIVIRFTAYETIDGKTKKIYISGAEYLEDNDPR